MQPRPFWIAPLVLSLLCAVPSSTAFAQVTEAPETSDLSGTMESVRLHEHGPTNKGVQFEQAPIPTPGEGELLIEVHAASVIPGDWKLRNGVFGDVSSGMPFVLGYDVSGVVLSVAEEVTAFKAGDEVFAYLPYAGAFAEYAVGPADVFAHKPENITHLQAASVPVSGLAAWEALTNVADLQAGQTVLIQAGAGGVGHFAVQIAKALGATVYTTASARNHEFLKGLGADVVIDYHTQKFEDVVKQVDVVIEMIGGEVLERSYGVVKPGGIIVTMNQQVDQGRLDELGIRGRFNNTPTNTKILTELAELLEDGRVVPHVSKVFPLSETAKAMELNEQGHTQGKLAIKVR